MYARHWCIYLILACTSSMVNAATEPPPSDLDALALEPEPVIAQTSAATKLYVEGALGRAARRYGLDSETISRQSIDFRTSLLPAKSIRAHVSLRVDAAHPPDSDVDSPVLSAREAYLTWQPRSVSQVLEVGRINIREGPGYGYNPTDFFRYNALRTISTINPFTLRENRLGTVMARGQFFWTDSSLDAIYAPKLDSSRSHEGISLDLGATNSDGKAMLVLSNKLAETLSTRLLLYHEEETGTSVGGSFTALVSPAAVAHAEWSAGREPSLLQRALGQNSDRHFGSRFAAGLTYTTPFRLSLTAEYQYNGFALDRIEWQTLRAGPTVAQIAYFDEARRRQDNSARNALLIYAVQRDAGVKNLEITTLLKFNRSDRSTLLWLDLRYHFDSFDLALQAQKNTGSSGSEFGIIPAKHAAGLVFTYYFL